MEATCAEVSLEEEIRAASIIFAGTMIRIDYFRTSKSIWTRYHFDDIRYVKGSTPGPSLVLTQPGGRTDSFIVAVSDNVAFTRGHRYVVFAFPGRHGLTSFICGSFDPFEIAPDSGSTTPVAHVRRGEIAYLDSQHIVIIHPTAWDQEHTYRTYDAGRRRIPPVPPPREPIEEVLRSADSTVESRMAPSARRWIPGVGWSRELMRASYLWPHQDPGTRVTEDQLLGRLASIVAKQHALAGDSTASDGDR